MKLLFVSKLSRSARAVNTLSKYVRVGKKLGHEVAVFGEQLSDVPGVPYSLDVRKFDFAIFVVYETADFPDLPYLAQLLDAMPKDRRVIIDCSGRYNETIRIEHDFNHLEKMDGHQGWEWIEGFQAVANKILQPTLRPLRPDVRPFLFHGYDPEAVVHSSGSPNGSTASRPGYVNEDRPYGLVYVGHNWQRWSQIRRFLEAIEPLKDELGPICIAGADWSKRPDWAIQLGLLGADVDPALLARLGVETRAPIPFDEVIGFMGHGRFCPIFHRPLFNHLSLVTNRTFETFCADTIPLIMLPDNMMEAIYGKHAWPLVPGEDVEERLRNMMRHPDVYWEAVLKTRDHLSAHHSYEQRFRELLAILES